jgi:1-acyl-sn-glycerol-3-phosphate acyltransferase
MPPRWFRRVVIGPLAVVGCAAVLILSPVIVLVAAFALRYARGILKPFRLLWLLVVALVREPLGLIALFLLWVGSGFGYAIDTPPFRRAHVALMSWYLWGYIGVAQRSLGLRLVTEEAPGALVVEPNRPSRPVLIFSRHAGAGDSFILAHMLVSTFGRVPSIVLKDTLQWAPCIDVVLHRLPSKFISTNPPPGAGVVESIGELAAGLPDDGALILFPEGGNFTEARRLRGIQRLRDLGLEEQVAKAEELSTVLAPRPGGVLAALNAAPDTDVIFVAHTGLEPLSSLRTVLANVPMQHSVRMAWWLVPAGEIPSDEEGRIAWLYDWWERIDTWIEDHAELGLDPYAVVNAATPSREPEARRADAP